MFQGKKAGAVLFCGPRDCEWGFLSPRYARLFTVCLKDIAEAVSLEGEGPEIGKWLSETVGPEDKLWFQSVWHFMLFCKAVRIGNRTATLGTLNYESWKEQESCVQRYSGSGAPGWSAVRVDAMRLGNRRKFEDNADLGRLLLATGHRQLVLAARNDWVWGVGFSSEGAWEHVERWGENWFGRTLEEVRTRLEGHRRQKEGMIR